MVSSKSPGVNARVMVASVVEVASISVTVKPDGALYRYTFVKSRVPGEEKTKPVRVRSSVAPFRTFSSMLVSVMAMVCPNVATDNPKTASRITLLLNIFMVLLFSVGAINGLLY